jgi:hypothetical protein
MSRQYYSYPKLWCPLAFTHTGLWWASGDGLVWKDTDEYLTFSLQKAGDCNSARLNLVVPDPSPIECLKAILAEIKLISPTRRAFSAATLGFTILRSTGQ